MAWLEVPEAKKVPGDQPRSYSNDFQGKQTTEQKSFYFNASRLEVNNYITIIECGEKRMSFCWGLGLVEKHSLK